MTTSPDGADDLIRRAADLADRAGHLYSAAHRRVEAVRGAKEQAARVTGRAETPDGSVRVTTDAGGMVIDLALTEKAVRQPIDRLTAAIVATAQEAAGRARRTVIDTFEPLRTEQLIKDVPLVTPDPPRASAPRRRAESEEPFNDDAPSILRRGRS